MKTIQQRIDEMEARRVADYEKYGETAPEADQWTRDFNLKTAHWQQFKDIMREEGVELHCVYWSTDTIIPLPSKPFPAAGAVVKSCCWPGREFTAGKTWGEFIKQVDRVMCEADPHHVFIEQLSLSNNILDLWLGS